MSGLGVHFALDDETVAKLRKIKPKSDRVDFVSDEIEEAYLEKHREFVADTDKAWADVHRLLTDGRLKFKNGEYPLNHAVLGGELLCRPDEYILSFKTAEQAKEIAEALDKVQEVEFREKYFRLDPEKSEAAIDEDGWRYTWEGFVAIRTLYRTAVTANRAVLFTADAE